MKLKGPLKGGGGGGGGWNGMAEMFCFAKLPYFVGNRGQEVYEYNTAL
jgi:hypothetical protein